jgi:hypothetical protein
METNETTMSDAKTQIAVRTPACATIVGKGRQGLVDMTWDEYRAFPALNGSTIVDGRKSMYQLHHAFTSGRKDTDAMQYGRLVHCLLFEPREVEKRYWPWDGDRRGNKYKDFRDEAIDAGAEVIKATGQYSLEAAMVAAQSFLRNERVQQLIKNGKAEQTVLAVEQGLQCKGRMDWVSSSCHILTDLKNSIHIESELFGKAFFSLGYDIKLGLYRRWLEAATGEQWPVEVIVLESSPPHDVTVKPIPVAVLDAGVDKAMEIIANVKKCIATNRWPGVSGADGTSTLHVPYYAMEEETEDFQG